MSMLSLFVYSNFYGRQTFISLYSKDGMAHKKETKNKIRILTPIYFHSVSDEYHTLTSVNKHNFIGKS